MIWQLMRTLTKNKTLMGIAGSKRVRVIGGQREMHKKLHNSNSLLYIIRWLNYEDKMGKACSMHEEIRNSHRSLVTLGRPRYVWRDDIHIVLYYILPDWEQGPVAGSWEHNNKPASLRILLHIISLLLIYR